jgi:hypothetical protein
MASPTGKTGFLVAIGFEYPIECTSTNDVSWVAVALQEDGESEGIICVDEETS